MVVHRTAWNRLDVTDAATGQILTGRTIAVGEPGRPPEHYLDYFHDAIAVSPDGWHVADDGWVWHPVGMPTIWSLSRWLDGSVWNPKNALAVTGGAFAPITGTRRCWIGAEKMAISGIDADDDAMVPGCASSTPPAAWS